MTGPNPNEPQLSEQDVSNFSWWVCMLPFLVAMGFFVYEWTQHKADTHWLMYSVGSLLIGLVVTALIAGGAGGNASATSGSGSESKGAE